MTTPGSLPLVSSPPTASDIHPIGFLKGYRDQYREMSVSAIMRTVSGAVKIGGHAQPPLRF